MQLPNNSRFRGAALGYLDAITFVESGGIEVTITSIISVCAMVRR